MAYMNQHLLCVVVVSSLAAVALQGCGSSPDPAITTTTTTVPMGPLPIKPKPFRGVAYGAIPCKDGLSCAGSPDMVQAGYAMQWNATGRDDLGMMSNLGGNAVRLYHSMGLEASHDHGAFLDRASKLGMGVMPGIHTFMGCPDFDCFDNWRSATAEAFKVGYLKDGGWHPAISALILLNEPEFLNHVVSGDCTPKGMWCVTKTVLSALDGVLAAEREAKIPQDRLVRLAVTWTFAMATSIDGKVTGPGVYGFQNVKAGIENPMLANYTPRASQAELDEAFRTRWIHSLNTQSPWDFVKSQVVPIYDQFKPIPWFIGEFGWVTSPENLERDLKNMNAFADQDDSFMGAAVFQFQTAYEKQGPERSFGMFPLGDEKIGSTGDVCTGDDCQQWPVFCLADSPRAESVANGWNGSTKGQGRCSQNFASSFVAV